MSNTYYLIFISLLFSNISFSQDQYLNFNFDCDKSKSSTKKTASIDKRVNPGLLGYMPLKGYSGLANIRYRGSLADSLTNFFTNRLNTDDNELVLILENFFLNGGSNPAKFILSFRLYSQSDENNYAQICAIDTVYQLSGGSLFDLVNEQFCVISTQVNAEILNQRSNTTFFLRDDLSGLDRLERLNLPMYRTDKPACGIYRDYAHFKTNTPDIDTEIFINISKKGVIEVDRTYKGKKRKVKLDPLGIYAVSDGKKILKVSSSGEYFEIIKHDDDFYYDRPGFFYDPPNTFSPYYFPGGGRVGTTVSGDLAIRIGGPKHIDNTPVYRFKINYKKGNSIPVGLSNKIILTTNK